jgi:hypothetical protein
MEESEGCPAEGGLLSPLTGAFPSIDKPITMASEATAKTMERNMPA